MTISARNTIYAPATPTGRSGVAVVRVSGLEAWNGLKALLYKGNVNDSTQASIASPIPSSAFITSPHQNTICKIYRLSDPVSRETIDRALVLGFKAPRSFTGEDVVEYHIHGGRAVMQSLLAALAKLPGHRMAEPGEFTRRAFENGKMDLTEAEAIADLIDAETQAQKMQALSQMEGALSNLYQGWAEDLKNVLAHIEADLEFPDEDLPEGVMPQILPALKKLASAIDTHLNDNRRGERLRDGIHVAVIGAPNAGKSSLVNALAQRDVAIVSDMAGTTRDIIEVHLDLGGYPVILADTAGLRPEQIGVSGQDKIESEGIRRALKRAQEADIKLLLFDGAEKKADANTAGLIDENSLIVVNKIDSSPSLRALAKQSVQDWIAASALPPRNDVLFISAATGQGLEQLITALIEKAEGLVGRSEAPSLTRARHRTALEECHDALNRALNADLPELAAEDARLAIRALGRITGRVDVEALLDVIFRDFCIGK